MIRRQNSSLLRIHLSDRYGSLPFLPASKSIGPTEAANDFVYEKTGEGLKTLVARLINEQLGEEAVSLG